MSIFDVFRYSMALSLLPLKLTLLFSNIKFTYCIERRPQKKKHIFMFKWFFVCPVNMYENARFSIIPLAFRVVTYSVHRFNGHKWNDFAKRETLKSCLSLDILSTKSFFQDVCMYCNVILYQVRFTLLPTMVSWRSPFAFYLTVSCKLFVPNQFIS